MTAAGSVTVAVIVGCIAWPLAVSAALHRGALNAGLGRRAAAALAGAVGAAQAAWLIATATAAGAGLYPIEPWLGIGVVVPLLLGLLALRIPAVAAALSDERAPAVLAAIQVLRLVGGAFLVLLAIDELPPGFALPAGIGDVLVGVLAPFVAYALWRRPDTRVLGIAFNTLGLLDLVVAIPVGLIHSPGRLQLIVTDPDTGILGMLPMALIPTFVVPLALVLHVASMRLLVAPVKPSDSHRGASSDPLSWLATASSGPTPTRRWIAASTRPIVPRRQRRRSSTWLSGRTESRVRPRVRYVAVLAQSR